MTKELDRIKLSSSAQLGSLEDSRPVKRKSTEEIRKLRLQSETPAYELKTFFVRISVKIWNEVTARWRMMFVGQTRKYTNCQLNGHSINRSGPVPSCRYCGTMINTIEELRTPDSAF